MTNARPTSQLDVDLFVIGAGSGGVRAARRAAAYGKKVVIAEESRVGGTCVIRGCVPKKLMVYASGFAKNFKDAAGFGWTVGTPQFDWSMLTGAVGQEVTKLENLYRSGLNSSHVEVVNERAELIGNGQVRLTASGRNFAAKKILIATGARPERNLDFEGAELCISSDEVFTLKALPKRIAIVGGGYIGVEFAGIFNTLGTETTLILRGQTILRSFDHDLRNGLQSAMVANGIEVLQSEKITSVRQLQPIGLQVSCASGRIMDVDCVLLATGRTPNSQGLGLSSTLAKTRPNGAIEVDQHSETAEPGLYALGDVTDRIQLTPVAIHEAMCFVKTVYGNSPQMPDYSAVATAVFSQPELGTVGHSEDAAIAEFEVVEVYSASFRPMKATLSGRNEKMLMKLVVAVNEDRIVGAHILGEGAGEMIQLLAIAVKAKLSKAQFDSTRAVHPTAAEEIVTMAKPARRFEKGVLVA